MDTLKPELLKEIDDFKTKMLIEHSVLLDIRVRNHQDAEPINLGEIVLAASNVFMSDPTISDQLRSYGLFSDMRRRELVIYRQCTFLIAREHNHVLKEIGAVFGKNHATVLYGINMVQSLLETKDQQTITIYNRLKDGIKIKVRDDGHVRSDYKSGAHA